MQKSRCCYGYYCNKNDYVTNTSLTSQLNNLKSQRIATEVTGIDNKAKKMLVIF